MKPQEIRSTLRELVPDFAKRVAPIYKLLCWEWQPRDVCFVPTETDIAKELYRLIDNVEFEEGECNISTGGHKIFSASPDVSDTCWNIGVEFTLQSTIVIGTEGRSVITSGVRT